MTVLVALLAVAVGILSVLVVGLLQSHGEILRRLHNLDTSVPLHRPVEHNAPERSGTSLRPGGIPDRPDGAPAQDIGGVTPGGAAVMVGLSATRQPTLLAFLSTGCATCAGFWEAFRAGRAASLDRQGIRLVIVARSADAESPAEVARLAPPGVTVLQSSAAWEAYDVPANPYFVLVGTGGTVAGEGAAPSWLQLESLLQRAEADGTLPTARRYTRRPRLTDRSDEQLARAGIHPGHPSLDPGKANLEDS